MQPSFSSIFKTKNVNPRLGSPFPTPDQHLLLLASLMDGEVSLNSWELWKSRNDLMGHIDYGSFRMLPLLYKNLVRMQVQDPLLPVLKGVYRQAWCKNQKLIYDTSHILQSLHSSGIPIILLKGLAFSYLYYKDLGLRPMSDIDILVPFDQAEQAMKILIENAWKAGNEDHIPFNLRYGKSMDFVNEAGIELDLHWHPFFESSGMDSDMGFWERAVPLSNAGLSCLALCPEDSFLHVIVHGMRWNPDPPIRWIPDAITILENNPLVFDWDILLNQVNRLRLAIQFREALSHLQANYQVKLPPRVMEQISNMHIGFAERFVYRNNIREDAETLPDSLLPRMRSLFCAYLRQSGQGNLLIQSWGFFKYMIYRTKGKNRLAILGYYLRDWLCTSLGRHKNEGLTGS